jgi:hypothetical protein
MKAIGKRISVTAKGYFVGQMASPTMKVIGSQI